MGYSPTSCLLYLSLGFVYFIPFLLMENTSEICLCGKGEDGRVDDIKFYVTKVPYAPRGFILLPQ